MSHGTHMNESCHRATQHWTWPRCITVAAATTCSCLWLPNCSASACPSNLLLSLAPPIPARCVYLSLSLSLSLSATLDSDLVCRSVSQCVACVAVCCSVLQRIGITFKDVVVGSPITSSVIVSLSLSLSLSLPP